MVERVKAAIAALSGVDDWLLRETDREARERFYAGGRLDMARGSRVRECAVTLHSDDEGPAGKARGSASCVIRAGMSAAEIARSLELCRLAASLSRGPWFPLIEGKGAGPGYPPPALGAGKMEDWAERFSGAFLSGGAGKPSGETARLNSLELFVRRERVRVLNSRGVDESYEAADAYCEYIVQAEGEKEEIELFRDVSYASFDESAVRSDLEFQLRLAEDRAAAAPLGELGDAARGLPVILSGSEAMGAFFGYFLERTDARNVYDGASDSRAGSLFGAEGSGGDALSLTLVGRDDRLSAAVPVDSDGLGLSELAVVSGGKVLSLHGEAKYCGLLGLSPRGAYRAGLVAGGSLSAAEMRGGSHVECVSFSAFEMEAATGNFGGEVRLGYYSDGKRRVPFSGGAVSGRMKSALEGLRFSRETAAAGNLIAPECALLPSVSVSSG